jgi:hypothetical protein
MGNDCLIFGLATHLKEHLLEGCKAEFDAKFELEGNILLEAVKALNRFEKLLQSNLLRG